MDKKKRHYSLKKIKDLVQGGDWHPTATALSNAAADFDFTKNDIEAAIMNLTSKDFYKSMTTKHNNKLWQDVYNPKINGVKAYVKVTIAEDSTVVISFKRK